MKYVEYFIKCIIRRLVYILFKPKILIIILVVLLTMFLMLSNNSFAATSTPSEVYNLYDSIYNDLINRLSKFDNYDSLLNKINDSNLDMYIFYDEGTNSSNITGLLPATTNVLKSTSRLYIAFFNSSVEHNSSPYDCYYGYFLGDDSVKSSLYQPSYLFFISNNLIGQVSDLNFRIYVPLPLLSYKSSNFVNFLTNSNNINKVIDTVTDDTVSDDTMNVDTSNFDIESEQATTDNFFTEFLNNVYNAYTGINNEVEQITIPFPNNSGSITLYSDMISKHISGTFIFDLIQLFWTYIIGSYLVFFAKRIFDWLSTGEIAEKGVVGFIWWLDINNEIIKSHMM